MTVIQFPGRCRSTPHMEGGITHQQAMEVGRRYHAKAHAAPTVAHELGIPFKTTCDVLDGKLFPDLRRFWMDLCFP